MVFLGGGGGGILYEDFFCCGGLSGCELRAKISIISVDWL